MNTMKTLVLKLSLFFLMLGGIAVFGQRSQSEVPGDNFSLEGALELFKKSASPEEFERLLNSATAKVNNLDLNGDGDIDYIKVIDRNEGNVHAFILRAIVSETESQDVAVIELEKLSNGKAILQITGDADVYGIETIIEPTEEVRINAGTSTARTVVNVWAWPSVQYVYSPYYSSAWISPWGWSMRPVWWHTWRPVDYYVYNPWWESYQPYYSVCNTHRVVYAQQIYRPYRITSIVVYNRHSTQIAHYRSTRNDNDDHHRGRDRYDDDNGRGRSDDSRSNGRQNNSSYGNDTNGRQRSVSGQNENSRSSANDWSQIQRQENSNKRSSVNREMPSSGNRSNSDFQSLPNTPQRNSRSSANDWSQVQRQENSNKRSSINREMPSSGNRSNSDFQSLPNTPQRNSNGQQRQDVSRQWSGDNNNTSRQQVTRPAYEPRSNQRSSSFQMDRRESSGNPNIQRSGNTGGGGNKSSEHKRGRD